MAWMWKAVSRLESPVQHGISTACSNYNMHYISLLSRNINSQFVQKLFCNSGTFQSQPNLHTRPHTLQRVLRSNFSKFSSFAGYLQATPKIVNQVRLFSTRPSRVKYLTIATGISIAIGAVLLSAVAYKYYGRFKNRARGIEELDLPLYGRRSRVFFRYRGYVLLSSTLDPIINDVPWFEVRNDDIWVISYPKAGTTWVQEIVYLICTDCDFEKAKSANLDERFPFLEFPFPGIKAIDKIESPRFIKTHLPFSLLPKQFEEKKPKAIYIARNPKDTVTSLLPFTKLSKFANFVGSMDDFTQYFIDGNSVYGPWSKHVTEGWEHGNDDNVLFVSYEDLHRDFQGTVRTIAGFLGKTLTDSQYRDLEHHCSFRNMRSNDRVNYSWFVDSGVWDKGHFLRKGEVGDWKNHLSPEMSGKLDTLAASMEPLGLQFVDS